jgi:excisionase family DNA binding protein
LEVLSLLENIIGVEEAAAILGLSPGTIKNMCAAGKLTGKKIGKTWVLDKTNLEVNKMKTLNYTMISGCKYQLPEGFYAIDGRFGDQVYNERGENVTQKIMKSADGKDFIVLTDIGIEHLHLIK